MGTIYAIPLIYILEHKLPQASDWISNKWIGSTVLVTAGLAYCYIASAPILVMHAVRTHVVWPMKSSCAVAASLIGVIVVLLVAAGAMAFAPAWFGGRKEMLLAIPAILVLAVEIVGLSRVDLLGPSKNAANESVGTHYQELAKARANRRPYVSFR